MKFRFFRLLLPVLALVACVSCSGRPPLNRPLFETDASAAVVQFILADIPAETKQEAQIAYLSFGDYVVDAATPEFLQRFEGASVRFVDGRSFRDKEFAGKRFIVDTSTPEELTPLMLQLRTLTREGASYHIEAAWAFKELLSRKLYRVDMSGDHAVVTVEQEIDIRGMDNKEALDPTEAATKP